MINPHDLDTRTRELRRLFELKHGVKSQSLAQALKRVGRRLPRRLRRDGQMLLRLEKMIQNPKLARQADAQEMNRALTAMTTHLESIDVADRRRGRMLGIAGIVAANVLIVAALFVWWLWAEGYVGPQGGGL